MISKFFQSLLFFALVGLVSGAALAQAIAPDVFIRQISTEIIDTVKSDKDIQAGNVPKVMALVDAKVMPHVNFQRMTASAVGRFWRQATPDQQAKLQAEFKTLLVRVYAGALTQIKDQTVEITKTQPVPNSAQVVVQSEVRGKGDPIKLDYRLDKADSGWKIIDVNVGGIWLVPSYRQQFAPELSSGGVDGLIAKLVERNKTAAAGGKS